MPKKVLTPPALQPRAQSRRAASKEALKQMQILLESESEDEPMMIPSDDDVIPVEIQPPKKKYKLSHRKSSDGNDRDVIVLKSITNHNVQNDLELECWPEELSEVQKARKESYEKEYKDVQEKLDTLIKTANADVIFKGDFTTAYEISEQLQKAITDAQNAQQQQASVVLNNNLSANAPQSYQLVMDPRLGLIVGTVPNTSPASTPTTPKVYQGKLQVAKNLKAPSPTIQNQQTPVRTMRTRRGGAISRTPVNAPTAIVTTPQHQKTVSVKPVTVPPKNIVQTKSVQVKPVQTKPVQTKPVQAKPVQAKPVPAKQAPAKPIQAKTVPTPPPKTVMPSRGRPNTTTASPATATGTLTYTSNTRPAEGNVEGGLTMGTRNKSVVDLTSTEEGRAGADSREISFNKLQGKTYPSLVVVARPHLRATDINTDRGKLDVKVKAVLMHAPTKFTEWLIQQGLVRSEQKCSIHASTMLKLGMYSDVSKFPYSGGYVWISECCPQRFVSVFSGSLFEGSPHPPMVILKLLYHWACQTNIQNVTQWVKVDNLYVKGVYTWLRSVCTVALHTHVKMLGGPGVKVEVGVISLGTTSQDGNQRQVKVEVLGILESTSKLIRLRAVEPLSDGDRNYKKRFSKILEPIVQWVHPASIIVTDLTVDKSTLHGIGFMHVVQSTSNDYGSTNRTIMEYLRRIVPRMFQNTLSLLSRQIIQQFLDELVWREWFGTNVCQAFDNLVIHLAEQTRYDMSSLIVRLNKVALNPFKSWGIPVSAPSAPKTITSASDTTQKKVFRGVNRKQTPTQATPVVVEPPRPPKSISPDVPEQMVPLENYYYGTIDTYPSTTKVTLNMKCPFCKQVFNNNIQLMSHLFKHAHNAANDSQLCRYCLTSVPTSNDLFKHVATSHPSETKFDNGFVCLICETHYMNPFILGKHMSKEHCPSELPYQCGTCGYRCSNHKQAIDHFYLQHDNGATIQCPFCLKSTTVFSSSRNIVQNMNYFIQHLQKHQRKQFARRCGKCNLWFVQKDILKDHQARLHVSQRGKNGLVPWTAPRNGVMVPKSRMDQYPCDADIINFSTLFFNVSKNLMCKECNTPMDTLKHFPSFESCQNPNCQYSTCCTNAMQEHNARCNKQGTINPPEDKLPYEMFCVCGYSNTDGNLMARHLAICERKSAYPTLECSKAAQSTHSMLDVLGLVRKPDETAVAADTEKRKKEPAEQMNATDKENGPHRESDESIRKEISEVTNSVEIVDSPEDETNKDDEETDESKPEIVQIDEEVLQEADKTGDESAVVCNNIVETDSITAVDEEMSKDSVTVAADEEVSKDSQQPLSIPGSPEISESHEMAVDSEGSETNCKDDTEIVENTEVVSVDESISQENVMETD